MPPRIGPRKPVRLFLAEWREKRGLTQQQLADRLETSDVTVS
ncbi:helix-turn-helix domain-containing protein, partial [Bradyrhizobium sp. SZCCHNR1064]